MPFRVFLIPVLYGEDATEELNAFIASHRIAHVERKWIDQGTQSAWAFCVEYVLTSPATDQNPKSQHSRNRIDYKTILSPDEFTIFSLLRELRKELSQQEGELRRVQQACEQFVFRKLGLEFKPSQVRRVEQGISFLGCRLFPTHVELNRRSKQRWQKRVRFLERVYRLGLLSDLDLQKRLTGRLTEMLLGSKAAHKTMNSTGAAPAGMDMHGLAGKPKQLAQYAKNPWKTSRFERRGQESNN
jgi:hypothetical protein